MANKGAAQRVRVGEAALYGHLLGRVASSLQEPPRSGDARGFHPHCRRHPNLMSKQPCEMARAQAHARGELVDTMIIGGVRGDKGLYLLQRRASPKRRFALSAGI